MKKQKTNAGRVSVLALFATLGIISLLLVNSMTNALAKKDGDGEDEKVFICHRDEGKPEWKVKEIDESALDTHLGHGDFLYGGDAEDPKKDEEWCEEHANGGESPTPSPTSSGEPTATPTPEPTINPDVCLNLDGVQTSVPDGLHLGADGTSCVAFSQAGVSEPTGGAPAAQGQVLGASTMAKTGTFAETLYLAIMTLGGIITLKGLKRAFQKA